VDQAVADDRNGDGADVPAGDMGTDRKAAPLGRELLGQQAVADRVLAVLAEEGLVRGKQGLEVYMMVEIPANVILAAQFAERFDGFSIGSNDLTQLTLGVDRDSAVLKDLFDERDAAVKTIIAQAIRAAKQAGIKIGICGQAPSDYPDFAAFLVEEGIDSISLNPDSVIGVIQRVAQMESQLAAKAGGRQDA
jgi:pyruvate,water dikinase